MSLLSSNLKAFMAIIRQGTVHGAAAELHLTQTGVTQRIRSLEKELGTTLFLRSRKGMQLTQEGEALLRYCKGAEDLEGQVLSQITEAGVYQPIYVTITGPTSVMTSRIIEQCSGLYKEWPNLHLNFVMNDSLEQLNLIRSGKATLAIVQAEQVPNEMTGKKIKADKYILVATAKWRGRKLIDILKNERIIDFEENDQTTLNYLEKFNLVSHIGKNRLFANNNEAIIKLFCKGVGIGTLTQEIARPYIDSGELIALNGGSMMEDALALVWYPRPEMPGYLKSIVSSIK